MEYYLSIVRKLFKEVIDMSKLKVIFMGTPDFAVPCLKALNNQYDVIAVITQPDRPKGRGQKLAASPVKEFAINAGLKVLQPEKIKTPEFEKILLELTPDLIVVVAFGQILSKQILDIPPLGCINVHASLLPLYRGAAPIHWSIINGETLTGVTTMFMDVGLDTGDMLLKGEVPISAETTTGQLHDQLMLVGANILMETVKLLENGTANRIKQDNNSSTYAPLLTKTTERIDWSLTANEIHNLVRGLDPWPGSYCDFKGKVFKVWKTKVYNGTNLKTLPGTVVEITKQGFLVATGSGLLEILEIQPAGKRRMSAKDYVCGHGLNINDRFE